MASKLRRYRVDVLTKDFGIMAPEQTALPCAVQAARVVVTADATSRSHVVVRVAEAPWTAAIDVDRLRALFPVDFVSFVQADSPGRAELSCIVGSETEVRGAAAALATLKRAWGWDESPTIAVHLAGTPLTIIANPQLEDGTWHVAVT